VKTTNTTAMRYNGYTLKEMRKYAQQMMAIYTDVPEVTIVNTDPDVISVYIISKITWAWAKR
jgi:hypothetical protein